MRSVDAHPCFPVTRAARLHRRTAFSLVELLVVLAIIALLAAVLLPALLAARRHAERLRCLSNMRELGLAALQYAHDNDGYWPPASHAWGPGPALSSKRWHDFLSKYVVGHVAVDVAGVPTFGGLNFNGTGDPWPNPRSAATRSATATTPCGAARLGGGSTTSARSRCGTTP